MARFFREDFDRDRSFVVLRAFDLGGQRYVPGQSVDKSLFTVRRLRQMYDMRWLGYPTDPAAVSLPPPPVEQKSSKRVIPRYRPRVANGVTA